MSQRVVAVRVCVCVRMCRCVAVQLGWCVIREVNGEEWGLGGRGESKER